MSHGTEHHLEEAEHAKHAVHDPFDRRVAMTMAIVAALLACVTMLSHQAHNRTLRLQIDAAGMVAKSNIKHTQATDTWGEYQAKNIRNFESQSNLQLVSLLPREASTDGARTQVQNSWSEKVAQYKKELPDLQKKAEDLVREAQEAEEAAENKLKESEETHHQGNRFDQGELAVELALVLCSVAILVKGRGFWYAGLAVGLVGAGLIVWGLMMK
ncbi:MAG: DUF4337 domain-containing protein [Planctomycetes bacterium]|nr:DUF4337 domain-containing protein [Planctomycetota bacterium]